MKKTLSKNTPVGFCQKILLLLFLCFSTLTYAQGQSKTVTGTVIDEFNDPLIGVSVVIKGTTHGTMTDIDGKFTLKIEDPKSVIVFSLVGFKKSEITVGNQTVIDLVMKEDTQLLDEVVVIGFQSQKKVNMTASVSHIGSETFENRPVSNVGQALQGAIPGLNVSIDGGNPNKVPDLNIRGATTIRQKSTTRKTPDFDKFEAVSGAPLILVDGIEISNEDLNQINPADIESMSVLKDASAAAIYGTRATFGVILVQTKSGQLNQKARVNYSFDMSWDQPFALPDILDSYHIYKSLADKDIWTGKKTQYTADDIKMMDHMQAYINDPYNVKPYYMEGDPVSGTIKWAGNTNPFKELVKDWTPTQKHNVSVSGGSDRISYHLSLGVQDQDGMYKIATDKLRRYNMMLGMNAKITNWFNLGAKVSYNIFKYSEPRQRDPNIWYAAKNGFPESYVYMPILTGADDPVPNHPTENPASYPYTGGRNKTSRRTGIYSISPEFTIIPKELTIKADLSLTPISYDREQTTPKQGRIFSSWNQNALEYREATLNQGFVSRSSTDRYAINLYSNYNKTFNDVHTFSALLGVNQERETYASSALTLTRLIDPHNLNPTLTEDPTLNTSTNTHHIMTSRAVFGRLLYDYKSRYLFEMDARYDGSSKFPKSDRFQFFPTFSAGWRLSEEKFMDGTREWLDNLKFRGSWGKLGSQPNEKYGYQSFFSTEEGYFLFDGTRYPVGLVAPSPTNPYLTWEKAISINGGLDITALHNRLNLVLDVYERKTTDILLNGGRDYPALLGDYPPLENGGVMRNRGWELTATWNDKLTNGLTYRVGFSLSDGKIKITKDPSNPSKSLSRSTYEGQYIGEIWGYETGGILQESDFITDPNTGKLVYQGPVFLNEEVYPGYLWYKDLNGDGVISTGTNTVDDSGDRKIIGNNLPRYRYTVTAGAQFKGFDLDLMFQGIGKRDYWVDSGSSYWGNGAGSWDTFNKSWTPENTGAAFPMYGSTIGGRAQTGYLLNASYFMLRQAIVGYTLPKALVSKARLEKVRVHLSGYNLFTVTKIPKSFDPERISDRYPPKRTIAVGVQIGF